jgi:DNA-binding XRE family transcriptional regulator
MPGKRIQQIQRIVRDRPLTGREAARYEQIREQIESERSQVKSRIRRRVAIHEAFLALKQVRLDQGKSLADMKELTGMDRSALSKLETGKRQNPSIDTLIRYADALGKTILIEITDNPVGLGTDLAK